MTCDLSGFIKSKIAQERAQDALVADFYRELNDAVAVHRQTNAWFHPIRWKSINELSEIYPE